MIRNWALVGAVPSEELEVALNSYDEVLDWMKLFGNVYLVRSKHTAMEISERLFQTFGNEPSFLITAVTLHGMGGRLPYAVLRFLGYTDSKKKLRFGQLESDYEFLNETVAYYEDLDKDGVIGRGAKRKFPDK